MTRKQIRVLLLIKGLGVGGAERLLERALPYLNRVQFAYQIGYFLPWKNALVPSFEAEGIPVHCFHAGRLTDLAAIARFIGTVRREQIDLIHAHLPLPAVLGRVLRRPSGAKWLVYTEHNVPSRYAPVTRWLNAATYRLNDAVIAVSRDVESHVRRYVRAGHPRLLTIPNAIDADTLRVTGDSRAQVLEEFGFPADACLVVNVANLVMKKGHRYLLAAARRVIDREPRARFLLVGTGPLARRLAQQAKQHGLNGHVVFTGFRPDATRLLGAADLVVLTSLHEGLPVSLLESMALGRAVVATRAGGVPEVVVHDHNGILVDPMDVDGLADGILKLLYDPEGRARLGECARRFIAQRYGMDQMVMAVEHVYAQLAGL